MTIGSQSRLRMAWTFAILWNAISIPATLLGAVPEIRNGKPAALIVLIFPTIGLFLVGGAAHLTLRRRRFGVSRLDLSEEAVSLGGSLRGAIAAPHLPAEASPRLTFACINRVVSGSGRNRATWEKILWQEERAIAPQALLATAEGAAIPVEFTLPREMPPSSDENPDNRVLWRLRAEARLTGVDYSEQFEIPVLPAPPEAGRAGLGSAASSGADAPVVLDAPLGIDAPARPADAEVKVEPGPEGGTRYFLPAGRNRRAAALAGFFALLFSGFTTALAVILIKAHLGAIAVFPWVILGVFGPVNAALLLAFAQTCFKTTTLDLSDSGLTVTGRTLGVTSRRAVPRGEVRGVTLSIGMQAGETPYYDLMLARPFGRPVRLSLSLRNKREAEWLAAELGRALG